MWCSMLIGPHIMMWMDLIDDGNELVGVLSISCHLSSDFRMKMTMLMFHQTHVLSFSDDLSESEQSGFGLEDFYERTNVTAFYCSSVL